jgi:hypothetical protein
MNRMSTLCNVVELVKGFAGKDWLSMQGAHKRKSVIKGIWLQGMLGETYDRFIAGDAAKTKSSPLYLPDDGQFHGIGKRAQYKMDNYWDTNHVSTFPC